ncbi:helix-turn-helix domain-containing protein [Nostoc sp. NMS7]|uniref:MarR family transcriptional regulator n=1 Tax=Nostoc sp. NMS7 TaxID=2815391 RepID=UPI0025EAAB3F|nr:hypothetical protein [Nostoc sp. NMS7]
MLEKVESDRHPLDFYESPSWFVTELLRHVKLSGVIGEPCVGGGAIASLLQVWPHTKLIWTNDIDPEKAADYHLDAIAPESWDLFPECDWICTNPPYGQNAAPIIKNAFKKAHVGVAAFLLTSFLEPCEDRDAFLKEHPPSLVLTLPRYCFRKDKKGSRWATDNATISCFVWDKRATQQRIIVRPKSEIVGFYKNPDRAISFSEAQGIVAAMSTTGVDAASGEIEITTNYEKPMATTTFQFSGTQQIANQIAQVQEQLNQLTTSLKPYQECEQKAEELRLTVAEYGREMTTKGIPQEDILNWAKSLYSSASGVEFINNDSGVIAAQNEVISGLKTELARATVQRDDAIASLAVGIAESEKIGRESVALLQALESKKRELKALLEQQTDTATIDVLRQENASLIAKNQELEVMTDDMDAQLAEQQLMPEVEVLEQQIYELRSERDKLAIKLQFYAASEASPTVKTKANTIPEQIISVLVGQSGLSGNQIIESLRMDSESGRGIYTALNRLLTEGIISRNPDPLDKRRNLYSLSSNKNTQQLTNNTQHDTLASSVSENNTQQNTQHGLNLSYPLTTNNTQHDTLTSSVGGETELVAMPVEVAA